MHPLSLFRTASRRLDALAYIESITDPYSHYFVNDIEHTENNKQGQKCKLSLDQVIVSFSMVFPELSDNFCRKNCLMTSILMWCSYHLQGKQFPTTCNKLLSTCTFPFQNLSSHYVFGVRLFYLAPVRNAIKTCNSRLLPHITIQPLTPVVNNSRLHNILQS